LSVLVFEAGFAGGPGSPFSLSGVTVGFLALRASFDPGKLTFAASLLLFVVMVEFLLINVFIVFIY
jgi:hypothetical protein